MSCRPTAREIQPFDSDGAPAARIGQVVEAGGDREEADGVGDKAIAATLGISRRTASQHVAAVLDKL